LSFVAGWYGIVMQRVTVQQP